MSASSSRPNLEIPKSRYTSIIVSVVIFLLLTSGVLVTSIYNSLKIRDLRAGTSLSTNIRSDIPKLTQEIYLLNIMRQQQQLAPVLQLQTEKVTQLTEALDEEITTLNAGGNIAIRGEQVAFDPFTQNDQVQQVQETLNLWTLIKKERQVLQAHSLL